MYIFKACLNERLVSNETVLLHQWEGDTLNFDIKQGDNKSQISSVKTQ